MSSGDTDSAPSATEAQCLPASYCRTLVSPIVRARSIVSSTPTSRIRRVNTVFTDAQVALRSGRVP